MVTTPQPAVIPDRDDPFAGLANDAALSPHASRISLLNHAKRGYVPLRKVFVQRPNTEAVRKSVLSDFVHGRLERPLDALLLLHALQPILDGSPLLLATWATLLTARTGCTSNAASKAFARLIDMQLAVRSSSRGRVLQIAPLREDASGEPWTRPGQVEEAGPGYFTLPHAYWTLGLGTKLTLPGKAMLLILLSETTLKPTFAMALERAQGWYGVSERTAERGYAELSRAGVLKTHVQKVADVRAPGGRREVWHRAGDGPFSLAARSRLQKAARAAVRDQSVGTDSSPSPAAQASPPGSS